MNRLLLKLGLCLIVCLLVGVPLSADRPTPTPTGDDTGFTVYTVQAGDTLGIIAARFGVPLRTLMQVNDLINPDLIIIGQSLRIPVADGASPTPPTRAVIPSITTTPLPVQPTATTPPIGVLPDVSITPTTPAAEITAETTETTTAEDFTAQTAFPGFNYGIEVFFPQGINAPYNQLTALGMDWVKTFVYWRDLEAVPGQIDFAQLDPIIDRLNASGFNILLTVTAAPNWTRTSQLEDGPPDNPAEYARFIGALAERYAGRVQAYEVWHEPNLRREWNSEVYPISPESYLELLRPAYAAVKAADPTAVVVSAGLAPTGFNDAVNALDDQLYLAALFRDELAEVSDAIGVHAAGWANPPEATCCLAAEGVETHFQSPRFYFRETLDAYRLIMTQYGDTAPIWVTQFGWGTSADLETPSQNFVYVSYISLEQQAEYAAQAFEIAAQLGYVQVMILKNFDGCLVTPYNPELCYYSLLDVNGAARPVYDRVRLMFDTATN